MSSKYDENCGFLSAFAMDLFKAAGYITTEKCIYSNHSIEQYVYFDSGVDIVLSKLQRCLLRNANNVTHLFSIERRVFTRPPKGPITFFSIEVQGIRTFRSQIAYDIHSILHTTLSRTASIILFGHEGEVMLSMQGFNSDIVLSDWYKMDRNIDTLSEKISLSNMSLRSASDFLLDFCYNIARWYYLHPVSKVDALYNHRSSDYSCMWTNSLLVISDNRAADKLRIEEALKKAEIDYGWDFVVQGNVEALAADVGLDVDLELIAMEFDVEEDNETNDENPEFNWEYQDDSEVEEHQESDKDKYEYFNVDDTIFSDPTLLLKWIQESEKEL